MKTKHIIVERKTYATPQLDCIKLDNEISLALASSPPEGPGEGVNTMPNNFNNDPYKNSLV